MALFDASAKGTWEKRIGKLASALLVISGKDPGYGDVYIMSEACAVLHAIVTDTAVFGHEYAEKARPLEAAFIRYCSLLESGKENLDELSTPVASEHIYHTAQLLMAIAPNYNPYEINDKENTIELIAQESDKGDKKMCDDNDWDDDSSDLDSLEDFDGTCPECREEMELIDTGGYDYEYNCASWRYVCMTDGCGGDIHVDPESEKILSEDFSMGSHTDRQKSSQPPPSC